MGPSNLPTGAIELQPRHSLRQRARRIADAPCCQRLGLTQYVVGGRKTAGTLAYATTHSRC